MFEFGYPPVHLMGISYGGLIAMEIAAAAPQLIRSLAVALVGCRVASGMRNELLRLANLAREEQWRAFHAGMANALHYHSSLKSLFAAIAWSAPRLLGIPEDPERVAQMLEAFAEADLCDRLQRVSVPTLLVAGDQDPYVSKEILNESVGKLPQGELALYEGAGHSLLRARQDAVEKRIIEFFKAAE
jgi:pimeloyl-ACP methyl ester carboxylesterase